MPHTRPLHELTSESAAAFGGKSASLGALLGGGIPVPPGFAIASAAYTEAVTAAGIEELIEAELAGHDPDDGPGLRAASEAIVGAIAAMALPEATRSEIAGRYEEMATEGHESDPPVAVRSSAIGEDSQEATFAGQQETYLWVRGSDDVCAAVRDCWASLFTPEAMSYRTRFSQEHGGQAPAMGVAVQHMVDAAVSGVMFTCNPVSGDPSSVVVNASWGLGAAVVNGEVTPDEYRLSKVTGELLEKTIGPKEMEYVPDPAGSGTLHAEVPEARRAVACLGEDELSQLVELAKVAERYFGGHQDLEWAIERDERELRVLQSRPVTTINREAAPAKPKRSAMDMVMGTFGAGGAKKS
jgi:pyruvate,water dikinase